MVVTAGADSRAGELAAASVVVPPCVTLCPGEAKGREQASQGVNSSPEPGIQRVAGQLPQVHTPENQHSRPLPQKTSWKEGGRAVLDSAALESSKGSQGIYSI